ncbi:hypothetical protein DFH08DRAFT_799372 [Mycena albidolilacea]|uniref:Uncharacterized protein n=1 Tax=Mycena albidolilacea TaxID=1033008 RepID=A0AAD7ALG2_9AGAR|nr:hypothetical protein DFH08DRAFT_799372 [Mycena albidolilacea]
MCGGLRLELTPDNFHGGFPRPICPNRCCCHSNTSTKGQIKQKAKGREEEGRWSQDPKIWTGISSREIYISISTIVDGLNPRNQTITAASENRPSSAVAKLDARIVARIGNILDMNCGREPGRIGKRDLEDDGLGRVDTRWNRGSVEGTGNVGCSAVVNVKSSGRLKKNLIDQATIGQRKEKLRGAFECRVTELEATESREWTGKWRIHQRAQIG